MQGKYRIRPEVLDLARAKNGFTSDEQLAQKVGVTSGTIYRIRRGETPRFVTAIRLLAEAGMSVQGIEKCDQAAA